MKTTPQTGEVWKHLGDEEWCVLLVDHGFIERLPVHVALVLWDLDKQWEEGTLQDITAHFLMNKGERIA